MQKLGLLFILLLTAIILPIDSANAQARDSLYYMRDDGEFSDEEKDEEAQYIFNQCRNNDTYNVFFDCACIAGSYRARRDGPLEPQDRILLDLYNDRKSPCINTVAIAGDTYEQCIQAHGHSYHLRSKNIDTKEMCQCYANYFAVNYTRKPYFNAKYIRKLKKNGFINCISPNPQMPKLPRTIAELEAQEKMAEEKVLKAQRAAEQNEPITLENREEGYAGDMLGEVVDGEKPDSNGQVAKSLLPNFDD